MVSDDVVTVGVGSWVRFRSGDLEEEYRIVPEQDADIMRRLMSEKAPVGRALLGHRVGDVVQVRAPGWNGTVTVLRVD
jgi:transcription elongation factor GreA